jgi:hypothetical protein
MLNSKSFKLVLLFGYHLNWSDTTIGEKQFVRNLEEAGIELYDYDDRNGNNYLYGITKTKKGTSRLKRRRFKLIIFK